MKYVAVVLMAGCLYLFLTEKPPTGHTAAAPAPQAQGEDFLKAPLDRTHDAMRQEQQRVGDQP